MQNIDPIYFLYPTIVITFSFSLAAYWRRRRSFSGSVLVFSLIAYAGAIALKYIVQIPTLGGFESAVGGSSVALGLYYGLQTVFFEVGGAFVVAHYAFSRGKINVKDAEGYGIGLSLWENGVYLGVLTLLNYVGYYVILSSSSSLSQTVYQTLVTRSPGLFLDPLAALPAVGFAILERVSSLLVHFSWGYLVVLAAVFRRKQFLVIALPMGLIDFLTPFAGRLGTPLFEGILFILSLLCLIVSLVSTRSFRTKGKAAAAARSAQDSPKLV